MHTTEGWIAAWGNAISIRPRRPENYGRNLTLRYPVTMMFDGTALRVTLDNFCGTQPVTVSRVYAAKSAEKADIVPETNTQVLFGGRPEVTIPAGGSVQSDAVPLSFSRGERIAVSMYFADFTELRSSVNITGPLSGGYFSVGDFAASESLPLDATNNTNWYYFLSGIDARTDASHRAIVCYGDSITAQAWPDYLIQRVLEQGDGTVSIIRKAASGSRILRQYDNIVYASYGLRGEVRFPHEVPNPGADTVIIQQGINDIIHPVGVDVNPFRPWSDMPTAEDLIEGMRRYIAWARSFGMRVYLGTLLPIEGWRTYAPFRDKLRQEFNNWMRRTDEADGCIDFDKALRDQVYPTRFAEGYDSGDHLHPSQEAYRKMAELIPEELLHR